MDDTSPSASLPPSAPPPRSAASPSPAVSVSLQKGRDSDPGSSNTARALSKPVPRRSASVSKNAQKENSPSLPSSSSITRGTRTAARRGLTKAQTPMPEIAHSPSPQITLSSSSIAGPSTQPPLNTKPSKLPKATKDTKQKPKPAKPAKEKSQLPPPNDEGVESQGDEWYAIKDIVDEKTERGVRYYLIDWCNDVVTGKSYDKSWVCCAQKNKRENLCLNRLLTL